MSKRQVQKMLGLMASGGPVELTSPMASVRKLARLAFVAQQFGYEYADARQAGSRNNALVMLIVPDPSPYARTRAAQNWAQYPNAGDGVSLPPLVPDALELLKARINFDLTGKHSEKQRAAYGGLAATVGCLVLGVRLGGDDDTFVLAGVLWGVAMVLLALMVVLGRRRNAKLAARLQAAGFAPVTDGSGRLRYLPPGTQLPGQADPFGQAGPYGNHAAGPYGAPVPPATHGVHLPGPYAPGAYTNQPRPPAHPHPLPHAPQPQQAPQAPHPPQT
ncbi:membrane protein, partial [Streptomyces sp. AS58]|uniref:hypothetical protein n=1 Tax=Streptomyces sp. AS58 TaxID=1519489 RepID=UPI0006AE6A34